MRLVRLAMCARKTQETKKSQRRVIDTQDKVGFSLWSNFLGQACNADPCSLTISPQLSHVCHSPSGGEKLQYVGRRT